MQTIEDTYRHKGLRTKLIEELKTKGISDQNVLDAMNRVPRHFFMESSFIEFAYKDTAFPIGAGQTISQPYTVAFQTQLLTLKKNDKVLEIGTGSGYQTSILVEMGAKVYTIERQYELHLKSQELLIKMGYKPYFFYGDGYLGQPTYGPFDKILVTAGATEIPKELLKQLKVGGMMVIPVGSEKQQIMTSIIRTEENKFQKKEYGNFAFVPFLKGKA